MPTTASSSTPESRPVGSPSDRRWPSFLVRLVSVALIGGGILFWVGCDSGGADIGTESSPSLLDIVDGHQNTLGTFKSALGSADRSEPLDDTTQTFMVFAPANTAFEPYDTEFLADNPELYGSVLDYHIVAGTAKAELESGDTFTTVQGDQVTVSGDGVEGVEVAVSAEGVNGVLHITEDLLLTNRLMTDRLQVTRATQRLHETLESAEMLEAFADSTTAWTLFAPENSALDSTDLGGYSQDEVQQILEYHVIGALEADEALIRQQLDNAGGEFSADTRQGESITITRDGDTVIFNDGQATLNRDQVDLQATNGIIHQIDGVLIPPSLQ